MVFCFGGSSNAIFHQVVLGVDIVIMMELG